jgi:hypothetical protein
LEIWRIQKLPERLFFIQRPAGPSKRHFIFHTFYQDNFRQNQLASVFPAIGGARPASDSRLILFLTGAERKAGNDGMFRICEGERRTFSGEGDYDPCCP